jgi:hypothetical protein
MPTVTNLMARSQQNPPGIRIIEEVQGEDGIFCLAENLCSKRLIARKRITGKAGGKG